MSVEGVSGGEGLETPSAASDGREQPVCAICGSEECVFLGSLGRLVYFRCRCCGMAMQGFVPARGGGPQAPPAEGGT